MKKLVILIYAMTAAGCTGFQAPTAVTINTNGSTSTTPITLNQTNSESLKEPNPSGSHANHGTKADVCNDKNVICAYQNGGYQSSEIELTLNPKDIRGDSTATLDIKIPGQPFTKNRSMQVGDSWRFESNGKVCKLTVLNVVMAMPLDLRGGYIIFKLVN